MIGIHNRPDSFSDRWIQYCAEKQEPFKRIDCLATDVIEQCAGVEAVLWHWSHAEPADQLVARQIITALELSGKLVFPNVATCWHFDDKVAQKYLLEAVRAPLVPTWVFTRKQEALDWAGTTAWPKVFKLRCGAGSKNVHLVHSRAHAEALIRRAFGVGFPAFPGYLADASTRIRKVKDAAQFWDKLTRAPRTLRNLLALRRRMTRQRDYVYFQEYMPDNAFDTRITVIGNRAFGFRRLNRPGDFRASGSGNISFDPRLIDKQCVKIAFDVAERIGAQSAAFDFLLDARRQPKIAEISYCYNADAVHACPGHWGKSGVWHEGPIWPQDAILEDLLAVLPRGR